MSKITVINNQSTATNFEWAKQNLIDPTSEYESMMYITTSPQEIKTLTDAGRFIKPRRYTPTIYNKMVRGNDIAVGNDFFCYYNFDCYTEMYYCNYKIIINDETKVFTEYPMTNNDLELFIGADYVKIADDNTIKWTFPFRFTEKESIFHEFANLAEAQCLIHENGTTFKILYPLELFAKYNNNDIYILTTNPEKNPLIKFLNNHNVKYDTKLVKKEKINHE